MRIIIIIVRGLFRCLFTDIYWTVSVCVCVFYVHFCVPVTLCLIFFLVKHIEPSSKSGNALNYFPLLLLLIKHLHHAASQRRSHFAEQQ